MTKWSCDYYTHTTGSRMSHLEREAIDCGYRKPGSLEDATTKSCDRCSASGYSQDNVQQNWFDVVEAKLTHRIHLLLSTQPTRQSEVSGGWIIQFDKNAEIQSVFVCLSVLPRSFLLWFTFEKCKETLLTNLWKGPATSNPVPRSGYQIQPSLQRRT